MTAKVTKNDKLNTVDATRAAAQAIAAQLNDARATAARNPGHFAGGTLADPEFDVLEQRYRNAIVDYEEALADAGLGIAEGDDA